MRARLPLLLALTFAGACQSPEAPTATGGPEAPASLDTGPAVQSVVHFKVDGKKLPPVALGKETELLAISALPPIEQWKRLIVRSKDGLEFRASQPKELTGARTMKLVRLADNSYDFLVMQRSDQGVESIRNKRSQVKLVEILSPDYEPPPRNRGKASITITVAGKQRELGADELEGIERRAEPQEKEARDTWLLFDLLGTAAQSLEVGQSIRLRSVNTSELVLSRDELLDPGKLHIIKRNRRGKFHYRGWTLGEAPTRSSELRNLAEIELR